MLSRAVRAATLCLVLASASPAAAGPMGSGSVHVASGLVYSPGAAPFESFAWTPLDFAAFGAYGGDFANVRAPLGAVPVVAESLDPPLPPAPEDEQQMTMEALFTRMYVEPFLATAPFVGDQQHSSAQVVPTSIPEPGALALVGMGLLAASCALRGRQSRVTK